MEFKNAAERRAWLLARVEEVEKRRDADSKRRRNNRARVRAFVKSHPGSTVNGIAAALGLTHEQVWETGLKPEFAQASKNMTGLDDERVV